MQSKRTVAIITMLIIFGVIGYLVTSRASSNSANGGNLKQVLSKYENKDISAQCVSPNEFYHATLREVGDDYVKLERVVNAHTPNSRTEIIFLPFASIQYLHNADERLAIYFR